MSGHVAVSVIVCAHSSERTEMLRATLASLLAQSAQPHEIIAVIDHNESLLATISSQYPAIRVLANSGQQGLSGARNTGIAAAQGEVVAFIDDDALADPQWLQQLCRHYADPHVMAVGGHIAPIWPQGRPAWFAEEFDWVVGCSYRGQPTTLADIRNLIGCNMSFRRAIFARIGGFSTDLGRAGNDAAGCEETELCIRARRAFPRSRILYAPEALVSHMLAEARTTRSYFKARCRAEGRSKALVVDRAGTADGLSSERAYVTKVLPSGVLRGIADLVLRRDPSGLSRARTILTGPRPGVRQLSRGASTPHRQPAATSRLPANPDHGYRAVPTGAGDRCHRRRRNPIGRRLRPGARPWPSGRCRGVSAIWRGDHPRTRRSTVCNRYAPRAASPAPYGPDLAFRQGGYRHPRPDRGIGAVPGFPAGSGLPRL
jgi:GT2 family glycosyltransferase